MKYQNITGYIAGTLLLAMSGYIAWAENQMRFLAIAMTLTTLLILVLFFEISRTQKQPVPVRWLDDFKKTIEAIIKDGQYHEIASCGDPWYDEISASINELQRYYQSNLQEAMEKLIESEEMFIQMIFMINAAVEAKDQYISGHSSKVAEYTRMIVQELQLPPALSEKIVLAAVLHDVGKIGISESILNKKEKLTEEEYAQIRMHTMLGRDILSNASALWDIIPLIYHHHERWDGTGYPDGLKGEEIPLGARIIAVADAFDAMTSDRPYRKALPFETACRILIEEKDRQFEGKMVDVFLKAIGFYQKEHILQAN